MKVYKIVYTNRKTGRIEYAAFTQPQVATEFIENLPKIGGEPVECASYTGFTSHSGIFKADKKRKKRRQKAKIFEERQDDCV